MWKEPNEEYVDFEQQGIWRKTLYTLGVGHDHEISPNLFGSWWWVVYLGTTQVAKPSNDMSYVKHSRFGNFCRLGFRFIRLLNFHEGSGSSLNEVSWWWSYVHYKRLWLSLANKWEWLKIEGNEWWLFLLIQRIGTNRKEKREVYKDVKNKTRSSYYKDYFSGTQGSLFLGICRGYFSILFGRVKGYLYDFSII